MFQNNSIKKSLKEQAQEQKLVSENIDTRNVILKFNQVTKARHVYIDTLALEAVSIVVVKEKKQ